MTGRLGRLTRMSRVEVAWRTTAAIRTAAQRAEARLREPRWDRHDVGRALAEGVLTASARAALSNSDWQVVHDELAQVLRSRGSRFVLDPESAGALREEIGARWPSASSEASVRADRILAGQYDVLGYQGLAFAPAGQAVDWHLDPVHNRRAPLGFWADVPYLDPQTGDHKIIWELNRHQHWLQLGRAAWLTGDPRYGRAIVDQLQSWLAANPPLTGINWASMLEIGFRSLSWTWALHSLLAAQTPPLRPSPWLVDLLVGLDRQMRHVEQNLSHYFSPNTHLTGEALALYVVGHALPELDASARWVTTGRHVLLTEIERQIHADGGHAERSTHYQRYTLDFYLLALLTAERAQDRQAIPILADAVTRLATFTRTMADDRGRLPLIGDDDGGMLWPIAGRQCNDVRDSLALAAIVLDRPDLARWGIPEEVFWVAGRDALARASLVESRIDASVPVPSQALMETGYVVARDGNGDHTVFDAGSHGYLNGGHAHSDALALTVTVANRPLLIDPGTSTYTMDPQLRDRMRSSASHNTLTIDDRSQAVPAGPFHWRTRADGRLHGWRHNAAFDWAEASHDGYGALVHRRTLFRIAGQGWLVVDDITGEGRHSAAAHWHFDPAWTVTTDAPGRVRAEHPEGHVAWLLNDGGELRLARGDQGSGLGWCAPAYGTLVPTWSARVTRDETAPFAMMTWIGAAYGPLDAPPLLERLPATCENGERAVAARVISGCRTSVFLVRPDRPASSDGPGCALAGYRTDARFLHYTEEAGRLIALDLIDATYAHATNDDGISVRADEMLPDLHISLGGGRVEVSGSQVPASLRVESAPLST